MSRDNYSSIAQFIKSIYTNTMRKEKNIQAMQDFHLPAYAEIPDVGLYLEQVVKYINSFFCDFEEMKITNSMVSNYVKSKLVSNPHKKMYSRDQIAVLFFIAIAKNVLSMEYIRICLQERTTLSTIEEAYAAFAKKMQDTVHGYKEASSASCDFSANEETAVNNITIAVANKMYLERYFAQFKKA